MGFFALGLEQVLIYSDRDWFGYGEVRFHSFVSDQHLSLPGAQALMDATSLTERRAIVKGLTTDVLSLWETIDIENISDHHRFKFGDTGKVLYQSDTIPMRLDWFMVAIDDDGDLRKVGKNLEAFMTDERVDTISSAIVSMANASGNPAAAAGIVLGKQLLKGISFVLKNNSDDQVGVVEQSFVRPLHYPAGTRHGVGVPDLSGNMWYDYFIYGME